MAEFKQFTEEQKKHHNVWYKINRITEVATGLKSGEWDGTKGNLKWK